MKGRAGRLAAVLALCAGLAGCRHKTSPPVVPVPPATPVPLAKTPETPSKLTPLPTVPPPLTTVTVPEKTVKKAKKKPAPSIAQASPAPAAPTPAAAVAPPPPTPPIGVLTLGSDETPAKHQQAQDLISMVDKRLAGLPPALQQTQREQVARVVNFQQEAQKALRGGDADGAITLATKASLLLDDLLK